MQYHPLFYDYCYFFNFSGLHYVPLKNTHIGSERKRRSAGSTTDNTIDVSNVDREYCVVIQPPPPTPPPTDPPGVWITVEPTITNDSLIYSIDVTTTQCLFWNETSETWESNGCYVSDVFDLLIYLLLIITTAYENVFVCW